MISKKVPNESLNGQKSTIKIAKGKQSYFLLQEEMSDSEQMELQQLKLEIVENNWN